MVFVVVRRGKRLATDKSAHLESVLLSMQMYFDKKAQDSPESEDQVFGKMVGLELAKTHGDIIIMMTSSSSASRSDY